MKSLKKVALAAAVACVAAGNAFAAVDFDPAGPNTPPTYAKELVVAGTTTVSGAAMNASGEAGFGVVAGQTRYVRFQLANAKFSTAVDALTDFTFGGVAAANFTVVQGGNANDSFVVIQVQADVNVLQNAAVTFAIGTGVGVVLTSATDSATISYSLYEDAPSAAAGGSSGRLNTGNNAAVTLAGVASGLDFSATPTTTTVDVAAATGAYSKFLAGGAGTSTVLAQVGTVTYKGKTGVLTPAGVQVVMGDLVAAGTKLVLKTSDVVSATGSAVTLNAADCSGAGIGAAGVISVDKKSVDLVINTLDTVNGAAICHAIGAGNAVAIANQTFTIESDVVAAAGSTLGDSAAAAAGEYKRNGTVLKAAFADAGVSGFGNSVHLTNTSSSAATYTTRCITEAGPVVGNGGSVAANSSLRRNINSAGGLACPAANTRGIELTFAVPSGSVIGSIVRQNVTTGQAGFDSMTGNQ